MELTGYFDDGDGAAIDLSKVGPPCPDCGWEMIPDWNLFIREAAPKMRCDYQREYGCHFNEVIQRMSRPRTAEARRVWQAPASPATLNRTMAFGRAEIRKPETK